MARTTETAGVTGQRVRQPGHGASKGSRSDDFVLHRDNGPIEFGNGVRGRRPQGKADNPARRGSGRTGNTGSSGQITVQRVEATPRKHKAKAKEDVIRADARARGGKKKRLELLSEAPPDYEFPAPQLARRYYEEARLCFYSGAYVATIIMAQLAFEELLRTYYRAVEGDGCLPNGTKVSECGFADLIVRARRERLVPSRDVRRLEKLRMMRNPYVHSREEGKKQDQTRQTLKLTFPEYVGISTEDEAQKAVTTLIEVFPRMSHKIWGEEDDEHS